MRWCGLVLGLWLGACAGTETGNPSFAGTLGYDAYSSQPRRVALRTVAEGTPTVVDSAWLVLGDVSFVAASACSASAHDAAHVPGLGAGDHVATQAPATEFELPAGRYCGVRLPLTADGTVPAGAPAELVDRSILISGQLPDGTPFRIASSLKSELFLRADAVGFALDADSSGVLIGFDVAHWIGELAWPTATASADGTIEVDAAHNAALLAEVEARIGAGVALFADRDGDGELDRDSAPIAIAQ